jgi:hypothetical protein
MATPTITERKLDAQIRRAVQAGRKAAKSEPRAKSARYDATSRQIVVQLTNGCTFMFPAKLGQGLRGASDEQLSEVEVLGRGSGLHWESLDADLSIPQLVMGIFGSKAWMTELARRGGSAKTAAKAAAARANGAKGGRPRKAA